MPTVNGFWFDEGATVDVQTSNRMVWFADPGAGCRNLMIEEHPDSCDGGAGISPLFFDAQWQPIEYNVEEEYIENGFKEQHLQQRVVRRTHVFIVSADRYYRNFVYELLLRNTRLQMTVYGDWSGTYEIYEPTIEDEQLNEDTIILTIRFRTEANSQVDTFGVRGCCVSLGNDPHAEDPCDGTTGGGGSGGSVDCESGAISVSESGGILTADVSSYADPVTVKWTLTKDGITTLLSNNALTVTMGDYGVYRATVNECNEWVEYVYLDPCVTSVYIRRDTVDTLVADITDGGGSITWYIWDDNTSSWVTATNNDGTTVLVVDQAGLYKVTVVGDTCTVEDTEEVGSVDTCIMGVTISENGNDLEANVTDAPGVVTYTWFYNDGSGDTIIGSDQTIEKQGDGLYRVDVTSGGCIAYNQILIMNSTDCSCFGVNISSEHNETYVTLTAEILNPPSGGSTDVAWYLNTGSGYVEIGSGQTIDINQNGLVKVVVTNGDCTAEQEFYACVDFQDPSEDANKYERFRVVTETDIFEITSFTLPDPNDFTEDELSAILDVYVNQVHMVYDTNNEYMNGYQIINGEIKFNREWSIGSLFEVVMHG